MVLTMIFVYIEIGWLFIAPMIMLFLLIPVQAIFSRRFMALRKVAVKFRDERIKSISDMLIGIIVVKLYAWEVPFKEKINTTRMNEIKSIWSGNVMKAINEAIFFVSGVMINTVTFLAVFYAGGVLRPSSVFSVATYIQFLKLSLTNFLPKALQLLSECSVSVQRISEFLALPEVERSIPEEKAFLALFNDPDLCIVIKDGSFCWNSATPEIKALTKINFKAHEKSLNIIVGPVAAGKTSFLHAILSDIHQIEGQSATRSKRFAYVSQSAWILSGTIKDNILFGKPFDLVWFHKVIEACSLNRDLSLLPDGADSLLGERGVTLSGGQRARIALARAVYADADIYLLDDPLSAVDTKVGRHLFENCITKLLKDKTIILATHQLQHLAAADQVVVLEGGHISCTGKLSDVVQNDKSNFCSVIKDYQSEDSSELQGPAISSASDQDEVKIEEDQDFVKKASQEETAKGSVPFSLYKNFLLSGTSAPVVVLLIFLMVLGQVVTVATDFWLSSWSNSSALEQSRAFYQYVLIIIAVSAIIIAVLRALLFFYVCYTASEQSFKKMLNSVFRSPLSFFQSVPHGRIMNRFSKDMNLMDEMLPQVFFDFAQCFFLTLAAMVVGVYVFYFFLIIIPFLLVIFYYLRKMYMITTRQVKRIESITRSPVYSTIPSTLEGLPIIRAFGAENRFLQEFFYIQNTNTRVFFSYLLAGRWLGFRLDLIASVLVSLASFGILLLEGILKLNPGTAGLLLTYLLQLTGLLQWAVRQSAELENLMVSTERVFEYSKLEPEAPSETDIKPGPNWPEKGEVDMKNMSLTYSNLEDPKVPLAPILKNISIHLDPGVKCGIVGRVRISLI